MSAWIETEQGSLVKASSLIVSIREARGSGDWEVVVNAGPGPAVFAPGLKDQVTAQRLRNMIALHVDRADSQPGSICIAFRPGDIPTVISTAMEG